MIILQKLNNKVVIRYMYDNNIGTEPGQTHGAIVIGLALGSQQPGSPASVRDFN